MREKPEPGPGKFYLIEARDCEECGKPLLKADSKARGCGETCWRKRHGVTEYARLEAEGQLPMAWEVRA